MFCLSSVSFHPLRVAPTLSPFVGVSVRQAVREDLDLQRLVLETCRGHLRALRTGSAAGSAGSLTVDVGGGASAKGVGGGLSSGSGGREYCPQDEADAGRAGRAAAKRCTVLAPLLLQEVFRQVCVCLCVFSDGYPRCQAGQYKHAILRRKRGCVCLFGESR